MTAPVSVVIPAYGHAAYVLASVESALSQTPPPREVIVIDDSSPDDTAARLAPLVRDKRIRYVHQPNAGMAAARNAGAKLATSEYLYFLDDDDLMFPNALGWLVEELERYPTAALAYGESVVFSVEVPPPPDTWSETWEADPRAFMVFNQVGCPGQALIRRNAFVEVGGFDARIWGTDDWDLWLRLLARYPARAAGRPVLAYRLHADNASRNVARMYESSLKVAKRHLPNFSSPTLLRFGSYRHLRIYHAPRLEAMFRRSAQRGEWQLVAAAARAWMLAWGHDAFASAALKANLVRRGRWRLAPGEPL